MDYKICIVGLGYVGIQLACEFVKKVPVYGYDTNKEKIQQYKNGIDNTQSIDTTLLDDIIYINELSDIDIYNPNVWIICVPTPIDKNKKPDITMLTKAITNVAFYLKKGDTVIIESTVAPKTTREICIPTLEKISLLKCNEDFYVGFSPERLHPGKNGKKLKQITKLVSGSSNIALEKVYDIYHLILPKNKLHKCSSLEVAETSKLLENIKRDVNIALLNEFQMICSDTGINFHDVLESAETKFNFNSDTYRPGMVGGHCIGVDPYYFINYENEYNKDWYGLIDSARTVNEVVPFFLANNILNRINKEHPRITILGFSFKENCNDIRNTKIYDLYKYLTDAGAEVYIVDNKCNKKLVKEQYDIDLLDEILIGNDCIFVALNEPDLIPHDIESKLYDDGFIFDYKGLFKDYLDDIANNNLIDKNKIPFDRIITL